MAEYKAPLEDMKFVLNDVFKATELWASMEATKEVDADLVDAILEEGAKLTENELFPLNRDADEEGCDHNGGNVKTPKGFKEAFKTFAENGWTGLGGLPEFDGQGMPKMLTAMFEEMLYSSNSSFALYPILSNGASLAIANHATQEIKERFLPKLYEGRWSATMCLTEPHSGTDLGIIRTKAIPNADGTYDISGTKIFITGGEHDLTENILHLVLAKLPDAPAGPKGISLFLVPRHSLNDDDSNGELNGVTCGSIEHKMGIKGSATCVMNFDSAKGQLIGELNQGLVCMFTMMNYERLSIGIQGTGLAEVSYQNARTYAKERVQGRAATGAQQPDQVADPILVHPDVRKMLLTMRAFNEGGRAFASYVALHLDRSKFSDVEEDVAASSNLVALLTPVAKAFFSDKGFEGCVLGQQVFGGHGYIREWGMEQYVRDARIAQIYEGTNGVQSLDLMGRKVARNGGKFVAQFVTEMKDFVAANKTESFATEFTGLSNAITELEVSTAWVIAQAAENPNEVGAASVEYLELFSLTAYAYMWAKMLITAEEKKGDNPFYDNKIQVGKFFFAKLLPKTLSLAVSIKAGSDVTMSLSADGF